MVAISSVAFVFDILKVACIPDDGEASMTSSLRLLVVPWLALALAVAMPIMLKRGLAPVRTST